MLVGPDDRGIDGNQPLDVARRVRLRLGGPQHPVERPVRRPPAKTRMQRGPWTVTLGHIPPGRPGPELPHDPVQDPAVPPPHRRGQQRPDELPLGIGQFMATYHDTMIHQ